jgi:hypothetical protein
VSTGRGVVGAGLVTADTTAKCNSRMSGADSDADFTIVA